MPRAVAAHSFGTADSIGLIEVESRSPGDGEVTLAVRVAALNPYDLKMVAGGTDPAKLPLRLGGEAAGVVTAVGAGALLADGSPAAVGDEVFGNRLSGALADEVTAKADRLLRKPAGLAFDAAAGLLTVGTTAWHALDAVGIGVVAAPGEAPGASSPDVVLVHGAAGSVGRMSVQLAVHRGARVIGTASPSRHDELRALGAIPVAYGDGLADRVREAAQQEGGAVTAAIDTVGTDEALAVSLEFVAPERFVTIANFGAALAAGGHAIGGGAGADPGTTLRAEARAPLTELAASGVIDVPIAHTFPLAEARAAYELLADGHAGGKVVARP